MAESTSQPLEMHIRVKRKSTVLFLYVDPYETVQDLKEKIQQLLGQPVADQRLKRKDKFLDSNDSKLSDVGVEFDDELFLLYREPGSGDWETVAPSLLDNTEAAMREVKVN